MGKAEKTGEVCGRLGGLWKIGEDCIGMRKTMTIAKDWGIFGKREDWGKTGGRQLKVGKDRELWKNKED